MYDDEIPQSTVRLPSKAIPDPQGNPLICGNCGYLMDRAVGDMSPMAACEQQNVGRERHRLRPSRSGRARAGAPATEHTAKALSSFTGGFTRRGLVLEDVEALLARTMQRKLLLPLGS
jgi:hypothetical protein